jgi:hypothetical protein
MRLEYSSAGINRCKESALHALKFDIENDQIPFLKRYDVALSAQMSQNFRIV